VEGKNSIQGSLLHQGIHPNPPIFKELAKTGGGCAHVCVGMSTMVIYNSRHVR